MTLSAHIANQIRHIYFGGNWTSVNFKDTLADVSWQQATRKIESLNTIATLIYHTNYYINAVSEVLKGKTLDAHDKYSFDHPPVESRQDWDKLLDKTWADAESFAKLVELLPENKLWETFADEKYGNCYRNVHGIIEHNHYHLGQIVLIKKLLSQTPLMNGT